jgi:hypothetical protein
MSSPRYLTRELRPHRLVSPTALNFESERVVGLCVNWLMRGLEGHNAARRLLERYDFTMDVARGYVEEARGRMRRQKDDAPAR